MRPQRLRSSTVAAAGVFVVALVLFSTIGVDRTESTSDTPAIPVYVVTTTPPTSAAPTTVPDEPTTTESTTTESTTTESTTTGGPTSTSPLATSGSTTSSSDVTAPPAGG